MKPTPMEQAEQWHQWLEQAKSFVAQGGTQNDFVRHATLQNRIIARRAWNAADYLRRTVKAA